MFFGHWRCSPFQKAPFFQMSWHIEDRFPKMKGRTWGILKAASSPYRRGVPHETLRTATFPTYMSLGHFNAPPPCTSLHFWKPVFDMPAHRKKGAFWNGERLRRPKYTTFAHLHMCTWGHFRFKKRVLGPIFLYKSQAPIPKIV